MTTIAAGASQQFTANLRGQTFTISMNGGFASVTGAVTASLSGPVRRTFGPLDYGQQITIAAQVGDVIVEFGDADPNSFGPDQAPVSGGSSATESQYTRALFFGYPLTQTGSVKDFSLNAADAVYCGGTTDADVYSTAAGYVSTLGGAAPNNKGLILQAAKLQWDLNSGQSLFVQARIMKPTALANEHIFGNGRSAIDPGFVCALSAAGPVQPFVKCGSAAAQLIGSSSNVSADSAFNLTFWVDGGSKIFNGWLNSNSEVNWRNKVILPDGDGSYATSTPAQPTSWAMGNSGDIIVPSNRTMNNFRFAAMRVMVIPAGKTLQNAALLDYRFNRDPYRLLTDADLSLVSA